MTRVDESVEKIKQMIFNKEYDEYGYLPSEGELCEILKFSKATIREAVRTLEVRGFIHRIHGKGIKVSDGGAAEIMTRTMKDMFEQDDLSLDEVLEVRWIIETKAIQSVVDHITEDELEVLRGYVEQMEKSKVADSNYQQNDFHFHKQLVQCSRNKMLVSIVNAYSDWLKDLILASTPQDENLERKYHYHRHIYDALVKKDKVLAKQRMEEHHLATDENKRKSIQKNML